MIFAPATDDNFNNSLSIIHYENTVEDCKSKDSITHSDGVLNDAEQGGQGLGAADVPVVEKTIDKFKMLLGSMAVLFLLGVAAFCAKDTVGINSSEEFYSPSEQNERRLAITPGCSVNRRTGIMNCRIDSFTQVDETIGNRIKNKCSNNNDVRIARFWADNTESTFDICNSTTSSTLDDSEADFYRFYPSIGEVVLTYNSISNYYSISGVGILGDEGAKCDVDGDCILNSCVDATDSSPGTCAAVTDECESESDCADNQYCQIGGGSNGENICSDKAGTGESCTGGVMCEDGLHCDFYSGTCIADSSNECESESDCADNQYCQIGEGLNDENICSDRAGKGDICDGGNIPCEDGLSCSDESDVCEEVVNIFMASCASNDDCGVLQTCKFEGDAKCGYCQDSVTMDIDRIRGGTIKIDVGDNDLF